MTATPSCGRSSAAEGDRERGLEYGLGLAICKALVEAHGGRIWAKRGGSGRGTRLSFTLPIAEEADPTPGSGPERPLSVRKDRGQCILVVDDDPQTLRYARDALTNAG